MDCIYRITHIDNIPHILSNGITHPSSRNANPHYVAIGNTTLIDKRHNASVTAIDGQSFNPGDFIPFYFYVRMPMLLCIRDGYNVPRVNQEKIVYLVVKIDSIVVNRNLSFFFSDAHAVWGGTRFYGPNHFGNIDNLLDKKAIVNNDWGYDSVVKARKQAEFLVKGDIPAKDIFAILCYNDTAHSQLLNLGVSCPVYVTPKAYY